MSLVAPLAGSVDRNSIPMAESVCINVAPLAGSVDRNFPENPFAGGQRLVAPLAGSVDRNAALPCMRAGLESVAPLAGSVDRNRMLDYTSDLYTSRSPRGERG